MAYFRTKLQIPGIFIFQYKQPKKLLEESAGNICFISSRNRQTFWSWGRAADKSKSKPQTACPRSKSPFPARPKLCNPECGSKCLQIQNCESEAMKSLSNCEVPKKIEKTMSYWEMIFGSKPVEPPIQGMCRRAYCAKQSVRERDPRLHDPRYQATPGDVFVFTEASKSQVHKSREPQPQPPPPYKLPKAVVTKKMSEQAEKPPYVCATALKFRASCGLPTCTGPVPSVLPYEELKPPGKQRKVIPCKHGGRQEDAPEPIGRDSDKHLASSSAVTPKPEDYHEKPTIKSAGDAELSLHHSRRHSRIEQLKRQTRAKEGSQHSELLTSSFKNVSQYRSPCRPPSCKMSTLTSGLPFEDNSNKNGT